MRWRPQYQHKLFSGWKDCQNLCDQAILASGHSEAHRSISRGLRRSIGQFATQHYAAKHCTLPDEQFHEAYRMGQSEACPGEPLGVGTLRFGRPKMQPIKLLDRRAAAPLQVVILTKYGRPSSPGMTFHRIRNLDTLG